MNCDEADGLLLDYVEGELDDSQSAPLRSHLEHCQSCRLHLRDTKKLLGVMDDVKDRQEQIIERRAARRSRMGSRSQISNSSQSQDSTPIGVWAAGARLGDFEIVSEIGRGGMGVVYRARQVSLHREVALKILPSAFGTDEKVIARFQREAQAAARLHHTNVVPVYAQGQQDGHFYYAMELIEGESLDHVIRARREDHESPTGVVNESVSQSKIQNLKSKIQASGVTRTIWTMQSQGPWRDYARLICGAAEGLAHAHTEGVLHRDIKPQNLLLGTDNQLHITDFGLARLLDEPGMTVTGEMLGTPAYMSPEQVAADRRAIDHRTDIFSLGSTFYELLTGQRPFEGSTRDQVIARICTREPKPPRKINPRIPVDLETICLRAMEKETPRRYKSAADMAADLRRYAENRPILARRVGPIEKAVKWVRRHPAMTTIIMLSVGLIVGALSWQAQISRARHEKAHELVSKAFGILAYDDYRAPEPARQLLNEAALLAPPDADFEMTYGLACLRDQTDTAIGHLKAALDLTPVNSPSSARILYLLAWAHRQKNGALDGAAQRWLNEADRIGASEAADHFFRGQVLIRQRPQEARLEYRKAMAGKNNYAQAMLHLGRALNYSMNHERSHEKFDELVETLRQVCALQSEKAYPRYLLSIAYRVSADIYQENPIDPGVSKTIEEHYALALNYALEAQHRESSSPRGYVCEGEYWEARREFAKAVDARTRGEPFCKAQDDVSELYQYRWRLYYWQGQNENAMRDLERLAHMSRNDSAEDDDPRRLWLAGLFSCLIQFERGNPEKAMKGLHQTMAREPRDFRALTSAACLLNVIGQGREAEQLLTNSEQQINFATAPGLDSVAARTLYDLCRGKSTNLDLESMASRDTARSIWPASWFYQACFLIGQGNRDEAMKLFQRCMKSFDAEQFCYLAKVFVRKLEADANWPKWVKKPA